MAFDRDAIYAALLSRLTAKVTGLGAPPSRRAKDLTQMGGAELPVLFLLAGREMSKQDKGQQPDKRLEADIYIYCRTDDPAQAPSTIIFALVAQVEAALAAQSGEPAGGYLGGTTLGGVVDTCKITSVVYSDGLPSGEGEALIVVDMHVFGGSGMT